MRVAGLALLPVLARYSECEFKGCKVERKMALLALSSFAQRGIGTGKLIARPLCSRRLTPAAVPGLRSAFVPPCVTPGCIAAKVMD